MADSYIVQALSLINNSGLWQSYFLYNLKEQAKSNSLFSQSEYDQVESLLSDFKHTFDPNDNLDGNSSNAQIFTQYATVSNNISQQDQLIAISKMCALLSLMIYNDTTTIDPSSHFNTSDGYYIVADSTHASIYNAIWGIVLAHGGTISYYSNYGIAPASKSFEYDLDDYYYLSSDDLPALSDSGVIFLGWTKDSEPSEPDESSTILKAGDALYMGDGDSVTLYAVWKELKLATINYYTKYGQAPTSKTVYIDDEYSYQLTSLDIPTLNDLENNLFIFLGWSSSEKGQIDDDTGEPECLSDADIVYATEDESEEGGYVINLFAQWDVNDKFLSLVDLRHFAQKISPSLQAREKLSNKVTSLSASSTDIQYPSAKVVYDQLTLKAALTSPALTGTPTAPTAAAGTNTTQIATTAFVSEAINNINEIISDIQPLEIEYVIPSSKFFLYTIAKSDLDSGSPKKLSLGTLTLPDNFLSMYNTTAQDIKFTLTTSFSSSSYQHHNAKLVFYLRGNNRNQNNTSSIIYYGSCCVGGNVYVLSMERNTQENWGFVFYIQKYPLKKMNWNASYNTSTSVFTPSFSASTLWNEVSDIVDQMTFTANNIGRHYLTLFVDSNTELLLPLTEFISDTGAPSIYEFYTFKFSGIHKINGNLKFIEATFTGSRLDDNDTATLTMTDI